MDFLRSRKMRIKLKKRAENINKFNVFGFICDQGGI